MSCKFAAKYAKQVPLGVSTQRAVFLALMRRAFASCLSCITAEVDLLLSGPEDRSTHAST